MLGTRLIQFVEVMSDFEKVMSKHDFDLMFGYALSDHLWEKYTKSCDRDLMRFFDSLDKKNRMQFVLFVKLHGHTIGVNLFD